MPRILIADDSSPIQKVLQIALARFSAEMTTAASLGEALAQLPKVRPDLIICDAGLPGVGSPNDLHKLQGDSSCPVIVLVGTYEAVKPAHLHDLGFDHVLKKPFDGEELAELVGRLLPASSKTSRPATPPPSQAAPRPAPPRQEVPAWQPPEPSFLDTPTPSFQPPPAAGIPTISFQDPPLFQGAAGKKVDHAKPADPAEKLPQWARDFLESYCREHFRSVAREVIVEELRRLAEEKSRHLVD